MSSIVSPIFKSGKFFGNADNAKILYIPLYEGEVLYRIKFNKEFLNTYNISSLFVLQIAKNEEFQKSNIKEQIKFLKNISKSGLQHFLCYYLFKDYDKYYPVFDTYLGTNLKNKIQDNLNIVKINENCYFADIDFKNLEKSINGYLMTYYI